ncbi:amidohydrolase [Mycolicibacterium chitae]|uniref:Putative TIM-barrel fold metal-dependent hydrolase n=2 Tax=Mycolicibacterium chitae TaxID=1792 RepID=A0A448ICC4_MYCCI|nr:amidohydrolase family protein [Mycolicibacterium chitae]BBZ01286.1 amidohydrolase [Mycolicibacterium chitae]VEG50125.1 putative TIM-barrel fold metal-dependent hydrolase [Mycolicibacterium chitae]
MLIRNGTLLDGRVVDVRVRDVVTEVGPDLPAAAGEQVLDAAGGTVLPGLHDHHVHLRAAAAAATSVRVGPGEVRDAAGLAAILAAAAPGDDGWIRAVGYHDAVAGPLDRRLLDALSPPLPVRVQHRSGALWTLNTAALREIGQVEHPDGRFHRADGELVLPDRAPSLSALGKQFSRYGITGVTDATPEQSRPDLENLAAAARSGALRQRLHCMAPADLAGAAIAGLTLGPAKKILDDDSLDLDALTAWIAAAHDRDHPVAVHCVTASQLVVTLAALRAAGGHAGDRIEHAAIVADDVVADLADLRVTVVTQPNFVAERGDQYRADVPADEHAQLWRVASLRDAGVRLALSTDVPFGAGDPWAAMRAAVTRRTPKGVVLGERERISAEAALAMFLGHAEEPDRVRAIEPGAPGDLCVLHAAPTQALARLDADLVAATVIAGAVVYRSVR